MKGFDGLDNPRNRINLGLGQPDVGMNIQESRSFVQFCDVV
jgi:hypothetical protein